MNNLTIRARLAADPEVKTFTGKDGQPVSSIRFRGATDRNYKNADGTRPVDFLSYEAVGATADFISKYFHKGDEIIVIGSVQNNTYEQNGERKSYTYIHVDNVEFGRPSGNNNNGNGAQNSQNPSGVQNGPANMPQNGMQMNNQNSVQMPQMMPGGMQMSQMNTPQNAIQMPQMNTPQNAIQMPQMNNQNNVQMPQMMPGGMQMPQFLQPGEMEEGLPFN